MSKKNKISVKIDRVFNKKYGKTAAKVVRLLAKGLNSYDVADKVGISMRSVAAFRANLTRGAYRAWVK